MEYVLYEKNEGVAIIRLNRPDKYNSFVRGMALSLQEKLDDAASDEIIRCIVITGVGKAFSAGQDLVEATSPDGPKMTKIVQEHYNPIVLRIRSIEKPIIAAVNGVAAGAGANIALSCDIVVATQSASFIQAFSKIGLIPDSGGTFTLPRLIGWQRASALMMSGDKVSATDAEKMGMIYKVFEDQFFEEEVHLLATKLSNMPTFGLALTKKALNQSISNSLETQLKMEDTLQTMAGKSEDYQEGVQAFLEKRLPVFKGK
ncbi:MAG: enoyl-CoA hydratase-related protein [Saprospiraceae bacterium]